MLYDIPFDGINGNKLSNSVIEMSKHITKLLLAL